MLCKTHHKKGSTTLWAYIGTVFPAASPLTQLVKPLKSFFMADLDVQPKKSSPIWPWILLGLGVIAIIFFVTRNRNEHENTVATTTTDTVTRSMSNTTENTAQSARNWWDDVDFGAPAARYDEVTNKNVDVRGNNNYGIYGIDEKVLFDEGKSTIRSSAEADLKQVAASINKRYNGGDVRVYGYTDAVGSASSNKQLAEQRAEAVRNWLVKNGNIAENRITLHPVGEAQPAATNATEAGRQQNRRVEIVAHNTASGTTTDTSAKR